MALNKTLLSNVTTLLDAIRLGTASDEELQKPSSGIESEGLRKQLKDSAVKLFDPIYTLNLEEIKKIPLEINENKQAESVNEVVTPSSTVYVPDSEQVNKWFENLVKKMAAACLTSLYLHGQRATMKTPIWLSAHSANSDEQLGK